MTKPKTPNICAAPEGVTHNIERITPEVARDWLDNRNTHNRPKRPARIARYARDQATPGHWTFTGQPIVFDWDGVLTNGQHTLEAIWRSRAHVDLLVVRGVEPRAQLNTDTGGARTLADSLGLDGLLNPGYLASVARRVVRYDRGSIAAGGSIDMPTHEEMRDFLRITPDKKLGNVLAGRAAEICQHTSSHRTVRVTPTIVGSLYYVTARLEGDKTQALAEEFWVRQVVEGLKLEEGFPSRAFRRRLDGVETIEPDEQFRYGIQAWNHLRAGMAVAKLQKPASGWKDKTLIPK